MVQRKIKKKAVCQQKAVNPPNSMSSSQIKKASTPIPLSPEEQYEASQLLGKSLFSALQLVKEQQRRKNIELSGADSFGGDDKVLKIPIPSNLMPAKTANDDDTPYIGAEDPYAPVHGKGMLPHIQRNIGKYVGSYGGAILGAGLGARRELAKNPSAGIGRLLRRSGKKGILGGLLGTLAGSMYDKSTEEDYRDRAIQAQMQRQQMLQNMYDSGYKQGEAEEAPEPGILGRAFKSQQNPLKLLAGGQSGFRDAKKDYYIKQRANIENDLANAQREYIELLGKIKTGGDQDETPYVDAFCNGIAHTTLFGKEASSEDADIADDSMKRLMGGVLSQAKKPFQPAIDTAATGLLGTGTGAAYLTYLLRKSMREEPEKYMNEGLPTRVELQPYA
jgi:hypothetical protein